MTAVTAAHEQPSCRSGKADRCSAGLAPRHDTPGTPALSPPVSLLPVLCWPRVGRLLADASARGVRVRLCFGSPTSDAVAVRDREEGLGGTLAAKIRSALTYYREAAAAGDIEMRLHSCTLYASLFRYDDEIMVNPHAWGEPASANPVLHLRRLDGGQVAALYMESFERVWDTAKPWHGEDV